MFENLAVFVLSQREESGGTMVARQREDGSGGRAQKKGGTEKGVCFYVNKISNHARRPAELKHIIKQRKRNQQGFPQ